MNREKVKDDIDALRNAIKEALSKKCKVQKLVMTLRMMEPLTSIVTVVTEFKALDKSVTYNLPVSYPFAKDAYRWIASGLYDSVS